MQIDHLRGAEALVCNCHELMLDASSQAAKAQDAVLQHRLDVLAGLILDELTTLRITIDLRTQGAN
jgi:hypothetical protein